MVKQERRNRESRRDGTCLSIFPGTDMGHLKHQISAHSIPGCSNMPQDQQSCPNCGKTHRKSPAMGRARAGALLLKQAAEEDFQTLQRRPETLRSKLRDRAAQVKDPLEEHLEQGHDPIPQRAQGQAFNSILNVFLHLKIMVFTAWGIRPGCAIVSHTNVTWEQDNTGKETKGRRCIPLKQQGTSQACQKQLLEWERGQPATANSYP